MEVSKDDLPLANLLNLDPLRLLDFHDHVGAGKDDLWPVDEFSASLLIFMIGEPGSEPGPGFDEHFMPAPRQLFDAHRQHGHTIFILLDLLRHTHDHEKGSKM